jgi:hypothetical protein
VGQFVRNEVMIARARRCLMVWARSWVKKGGVAPLRLSHDTIPLQDMDRGGQ